MDKYDSKVLQGAYFYLYPADALVLRSLLLRFEIDGNADDGVSTALSHMGHARHASSAGVCQLIQVLQTAAVDPQVKGTMKHLEGPAPYGCS